MTAPPEEVQPEKKRRKPERFVSLDAYRGFIMIMLAASGFGIYNMTRQPGDDASSAELAAWNARWNVWDKGQWEWVAHHFEHPHWESNFAWGNHVATEVAPWVRGCVSFWDLIQPAFMFMVGVAMPFSYAHRKQRGDSPVKMGWHAFLRAVVLTLMGVFLYSFGKERTAWIFPNVLAQIGLGYFFAYLLLDRPQWAQIVAFWTILIGTWGAFAIYEPKDYQPDAVFASADKGEVFEGFFRHWNKNGNVATAIDDWFLQLLPQPLDRKGEVIPYAVNRGGYMTLNFVPSIATTLLGIFCGQLLMSESDPRRKLLQLTGLAIACLVLGVLAGATCCPIVKRIWTPSWVLFSGGYVIAMLALFYLLFDILPLKKLAFPLTVVGMNSLAMYLMGQMLRPWFTQNYMIHLGGPTKWLLGQLTMKLGYMQAIGATPENVGEQTYLVYQPMVDHTAAFLVMWLLAYYMYRNKIHIRI